jgi:RNA polymerase sigma-70 factor (ECF subfamily)
VQITELAAPLGSDMSLLEAAKNMDQGALVGIFDLYSSAIYKYALCLCHNPADADNIVGDVFARLLDQLAAGKGPRTNLRSYLYQAAYHLIVDEVRFSRRVAPLEAAEFIKENENTAAIKSENHILLEALLSAIKDELTNDQRHVIILRFFEGFSLLETAEIIGKDVQNIKVIQNRAIAKLRKILNLRQSYEINLFT